MRCSSLITAITYIANRQAGYSQITSGLTWSTSTSAEALAGGARCRVPPLAGLSGAATDFLARQGAQFKRTLPAQYADRQAFSTPRHLAGNGLSRLADALSAAAGLVPGACQALAAPRSTNAPSGGTNSLVPAVPKPSAAGLPSRLGWALSLTTSYKLPRQDAFQRCSPAVTPRLVTEALQVPGVSFQGFGMQGPAVNSSMAG